MVKILNTYQLGHQVSNGFNGTHNLGRAQNSKHYKKEWNKEIACEVIEPSIDT
jgi:hypothetical protein